MLYISLRRRLKAGRFRPLYIPCSSLMLSPLVSKENKRRMWQRLRLSLFLHRSFFAVGAAERGSIPDPSPASYQLVVLCGSVPSDGFAVEAGLSLFGFSSVVRVTVLPSAPTALVADAA